MAVGRNADDADIIALGEAERLGSIELGEVEKLDADEVERLGVEETVEASVAAEKDVGTADRGETIGENDAVAVGVAVKRLDRREWLTGRLERILVPVLEKPGGKDWESSVLLEGSRGSGVDDGSGNREVADAAVEVACWEGGDGREAGETVLLD